jgi:glyoxylase-like metal-dependent hydrolase (beta-lactamase superfamily II)
MGARFMQIDALSRRDALRLAVGAGAAAFAASRAVPAHAQAAPHMFKLGAAEITVLSDGHMVQPLSFALPTTEAKDVAALLSSGSAAPETFKLEVNIVIVKVPGALIVIDCGGTPDFMPTMGTFPERLERAGIKADEVTHVIFTHAHPDHLWGVIDPLDDDTRFVNARHLITATERDFWLQPGLVDRVPENVQGMTIGAARRLTLLDKRIDAVRPDADIISGVSLVSTPGHTPGHVSVLLSFGGASLLVGGDALVNPIVSFQRPEWPWGSDLDRDLGAVTRRKLLDRLAADRTLLLGYHLPWPGIGRVERKDTAYRFVQG